MTDGSTIPYNAQKAVPVSPPNPPVLTNVLIAIVPSPTFSNGGQLILAVGGTGTSVYGMFGDRDGNNLQWKPLGQIGSGLKISAVSPTVDGRSVFVGTDQGNIYRLDAPFAGSATQLAV